MSSLENIDKKAEEKPLDPFLVALGKEVRRFRKQAKLTQVQLAGLAGTSQNHIYLIEKGKVAPRITTLRSISSALSISGLVLEETEEVQFSNEDKIAMHFMHWSED